MAIIFDPTINLWRDTETGITAPFAENLRGATADFAKGQFLSGKFRSFAPVTRALASFSPFARSGSDFRPAPTMSAEFGGKQS